MDNEHFLRVFGEIDDKYVQKANELYNYWQESQKGISVRLDHSRKFAWKTMFVSVVCTAAVMFGVFLLMLNIGKIEFVIAPASSGAEFDFRSDVQTGSLPELLSPSDSQSETSSDNSGYPYTDLFIFAVYAYDTADSDDLKCYMIGDMFGEKAVVTNAKTIYKISDDKAVIQRQEAVLEGAWDLKKSSFKFDGSGSINIYLDGFDQLGLPVIEKDFKIQPIQWAFPNKNIDTHSLADITVYGLIIAVDYETETITLVPQHVEIHLED